METYIIKAVQLILALSILVIIHEFGHFLFARLFGVRVDKFYIGFNPWFSLFKYRPKRCRQLIAGRKKAEGKDSTASAVTDEAGESEEKVGKKKRHFWSETEYGLGWIPFGGYCKIAGMIDESMDLEQMKQPPQPWEFRTKPRWQRLLIMVGGVLFNFLLAILIYAGIVYATGEKYVPLDQACMGMAYSPAAHQIGFRDGDIPLEADGHKLINPAEAMPLMLQAEKVTVRRGNDTVTIHIPEKFLFAVEEEAKTDTVLFRFMTYRLPTRITQVASGEGAEKAGIRVNDEIMSVGSTATPDLLTFLTTLKGHENDTVAITLARPNGAKVDTLTVDVPLNGGSKMGVGLEVDPSAFYKFEEKHYGLFESVPRGVQMGVDKLSSYAASMKLVFTKEGAQSIGGFGAIGSIFPESWDWVAFWNIAAFLSVALAFMNFLPIPGLDGGHILFLLIEMIIRRELPQKFMEWANMIGLALVLLLLLYANGMDIYRFFIK